MIKPFRRRSTLHLSAPAIHPLSQAIPRGIRVVFAVAKNFDTFLAGEVRRGIVSSQERGRGREEEEKGTNRPVKEGRDKLKGGGKRGPRRRTGADKSDPEGAFTPNLSLVMEGDATVDR